MMEGQKTESVAPPRAPTRKQPASIRDGGFTLVEIQIAVLLLSVALAGLTGVYAMQHRHLSWMEQNGRSYGIVDPVAKRALVSLADDLGDGSLPPCEVALVKIKDEDGEKLEAEVRVSQRGL